jgi:hypothetical protein
LTKIIFNGEIINPEIDENGNLKKDENGNVKGILS